MNKEAITTIVRSSVLSAICQQTLTSIFNVCLSMAVLCLVQSSGHWCSRPSGHLPATSASVIVCCRTLQLLLPNLEFPMQPQALKHPLYVSSYYLLMCREMRRHCT